MKKIMKGNRIRAMFYVILCVCGLGLSGCGGSGGSGSSGSSGSGMSGSGV